MPDKTARRLLRVLSGFNSPMTKNQRYNQGCNDQDSIEDCNGCGVMRNNTQDPAAIHCGEECKKSVTYSAAKSQCAYELVSRIMSGPRCQQERDYRNRWRQHGGSCNGAEAPQNTPGWPIPLNRRVS